jgi:hypothetical protein
MENGWGFGGKAPMLNLPFFFFFFLKGMLSPLFAPRAGKFISLGGLERL